MLRCCRCKASFDSPAYTEWYEHHGEFVEHWIEARCPACGDYEIYEEFTLEEIFGEGAA